MCVCVCEQDIRVLACMEMQMHGVAAKWQGWGEANVKRCTCCCCYEGHGWQVALVSRSWATDGKRVASTKWHCGYAGKHE